MEFFKSKNPEKIASKVSGLTDLIDKGIDNVVEELISYMSSSIESNFKQALTSKYIEELLQYSFAVQPGDDPQYALRSLLVIDILDRLNIALLGKNYYNLIADSKKKQKESDFQFSTPLQQLTFDMADIDAEINELKKAYDKGNNFDKTQIMPPLKDLAKKRIGYLKDISTNQDYIDAFGKLKLRAAIDKMHAKYMNEQWYLRALEGGE